MNKPERGPQLGVGAVVFHYSSVLLVKRRFAPAAELWAIPGGKQRWGETMQQAAEREILEETGIRVKAGEVVYAFDLITPQDEHQAASHYVVIDLEADYLGGELRAGSDVLDAAWVSAIALRTMEVEPNTRVLLEEMGFFGR